MVVGRQKAEKVQGLKEDTVKQVAVLVRKSADSNLNIKRKGGEEAGDNGSKETSIWKLKSPKIELGDGEIKKSERVRCKDER